MDTGKPFVILLCIACLSAFALPATAQTLDLKFDYGDEKGCRFAKGQQVDGDDYILLKPDGITTYGSACEFVQIVSARDGTRVATTLCFNEGEQERSIAMFSIGKSLTDPAALRIYDETVAFGARSSLAPDRRPSCYRQLAN